MFVSIEGCQSALSRYRALRSRPARTRPWSQVESAIRTLLDGELPPASRTGTPAGALSIRSESVATLEERKQKYYR
jgi:hypothetical protein